MTLSKDTLEVFIDKFKEKHDLSKYDFDESVYDSSLKTITFKCREHGLITKSPKSTLLAQYVCDGCRLQDKCTEWVNRANIVHSSKYDYSKVAFVNYNEGVDIICPTHGIFNQPPYTHLKHGCNECAIASGRRDTKYFITKAHEIFGDKYDYSKSIYTKWSEPIVVTCPVHGDWKQRAGSHLSGNGCLACYQEAQPLGKEEFIKKARMVHGDAYDYSNVVYKDNKTKVEITCPLHGDWLVKPNAHVSSKAGCPRCRESLGERTIRKWLYDVGISFETEYTVSGYRYRMDFFLPEQKIFIEHHGIQHYEPVSRFGGVEGLVAVQERDKCKMDISYELQIPLVVTTYKHLNKKNVIAKLQMELKRIYRYWFKDQSGNIFVFKRRKDLNQYLNTDIFLDSELIKLAESLKSWNIMF